MAKGSKGGRVEARSAGAAVSSPEQKFTREPQDASGVDLGDLDSLLQQAEVTLEQPTTVDDTILERQSTLTEAREADESLSGEISKRDNAEPIPQIDESDYKALVEHGILQEAQVQQLKGLESIIAKFEETPAENRTGQAEMQLRALRKAQERAVQGIEQAVATRRETLETQRQDASNLAIDRYRARIKVLNNRIAKLESDPVVRDRLIESARAEAEEAGVDIRTAEKVEAEKARQAEQERQKELTESLREVDKYLEYIQGRHDHTFAVLEKAVGGEIDGEDVDVRQKMTEAMEIPPGKKRWNEIMPIREKLIKHILTSKADDRVASPGDVMPFGNEKKRKTSPITYREAVKFAGRREIRDALREMSTAGDESAGEKITAMHTIDDEREAMMMLFQSRINRKKKEINPFWKAFDERAENDKSGQTEKLREQMAVEKKKDWDKAKASKKPIKRKESTPVVEKIETVSEEGAKEILEKGGFMILVPEYKAMLKFGGGREHVQTGSHEAYIRLAPVKSAKRNDLLQIAEVAGDIGDHKVGDTSTMDGSNFRKYIIDAMKQNFLRRKNGDFTTVNWVSEEQAGESIEGGAQASDMETLFPVSWGAGERKFVRGVDKHKFMAGEEEWDPQMAQVDRDDKEERMLAEEQEVEDREVDRAKEVTKLKKEREEAEQKAAEGGGGKKKKKKSRGK